MKEKPKRGLRYTDDSNEFLSPYSLEECINRIPVSIKVENHSGYYQFQIQSNIMDSRNQFIDITVQLKQQQIASTWIQSHAASSKGYFVITALSIPWGVFVLGSMTNSLILSIVLEALVLVSVLLWQYRKQTRLKTTLTNLFMPVQKTLNDQRSSRFLMFPIWKSQRTSDTPLENCTVNLKQLVFNLNVVQFTEASENDYRFCIDTPFYGARAIGRLEFTDDYHIQASYLVGIPPATFTPILFALLFFMVISAASFQLFCLIPIVVFFSLIMVVFALPNVFLLKRAIDKALRGVAPVQ